MEIEFKVNGKEYRRNVPPTMRLVDLLRDELGLTGTKEGCGEGECGSCTVLMNGKAVNSCLVLAPQIRGQEILTIEGLDQDGELDKLQKSFIANSAVQCGYCTPGMLMSAKALLMSNPYPSEGEIKTAIAGNLCRCTGYNKIVKAIKEAADEN
ncbi:aerobic-type carbon monoxide dehydrogenase, small subunit CoxS/CutS-like protein [Desulfosporosinus orientis DSM 765]|uniref:Aerobic-type carbon monoxide dehydrogenase, small subunit CoxS/CutS-like protein n=1 Tax=Desulfosporosinus orientis (strain ATCC 19365 / DSM 765 / NCIMB 8382 / VKM B-1628 / Singapore I) TaxID=768706 RepID=G7W8T0_DESOD|nr:(2Fe-2S)-binding protein [Desulfosporosinus orientis]AET67790.1 aerobic-type carbon monoxide dehydrogenase, small subunit CoxS/CutS-like protein [Desulfosporosinus orientis DSM 765]